MKKFFAVTAILISSQLVAQQADLQQEDSSKTLDNVVIIATKYPTKQSNTGKLVSVVTRQQIEQSIGKDLAQVLNEQTGIYINGSTSSAGKDKTVFVRGAKGDYTLIMVDGVPVRYQGPPVTYGSSALRWR